MINPTSITANRQTRQLTITWSDNQVSVFPFGRLRAACPCAECRGGHEKMSQDPSPEMLDADLPDSPASRLRSASPAGTYALVFEWEDGHSFGIFTWRYLRLLDKLSP